IINNSVHGNNPKITEDGDGIHISQTQYNAEGYYNKHNLDYIIVQNNKSFNHGRRGVKVQRSKVIVEHNLLYNNRTGVLVARNEPIANIYIKNNIINSRVVG